MFSRHGSWVIHPIGLARPAGLAGPSVDPVTPWLDLPPEDVADPGFQRRFDPDAATVATRLLQENWQAETGARGRAPAEPDGSGHEGGWRRRGVPSSGMAHCFSDWGEQYMFWVAYIAVENIMR